MSGQATSTTAPGPDPNITAYLQSPAAVTALAAAMAVVYRSLFPTIRSKRVALSETYWRNQAAAILAAWVAGRAR